MPAQHRSHCPRKTPPLHRALLLPLRLLLLQGRWCCWLLALELPQALKQGRGQGANMYGINDETAEAAWPLVGEEQAARRVAAARCAPRSSCPWSCGVYEQASHIAHLPAASAVACAAAAQAEPAQRAAGGLPKAGHTRREPPLLIAAACKPAFWAGQLDCRRRGSRL